MSVVVSYPPNKRLTAYGVRERSDSAKVRLIQAEADGGSNAVWWLEIIHISHHTVG